MKEKAITVIILTFLICVAFPFSGLAQSNRLPECETYTYVERDSALYLDVYHPQVAREDRAAVITLFGGGFFKGSRNNYQMKENIRALLDKGFTVISIDYRLGLQDSAMVASHRKLFKLTDLFGYCIDIAVQDCAAAVAWTCSHSEMLDIDPTKIILTGSSAGAITVLQLDYCRANSYDEASELPDEWVPAAVIPYSGGIMCHKRNLKYASDPAPTMIMHGTKDKIVNYKSFGLPLSSRMFGAKKVDKIMNRQEIPHWFIRFEGSGHEVANWLPGSIDLFCTFVDFTLSGRTTTLDATMTDSNLKPNRWTNMNVIQMYAGGSKKRINK